jgi:Flp pilus assembly protein TadG
MPGVRLMTYFIDWLTSCLSRLRMLSANSLAAHRRGTVTLIFAAAVIPLMMIAGLSVDYSFYAEAKAQLDMAADTASLHAVRAASMAQANGMTYQAAGLAAAQQWFAAEITPLTGITINGGYEPLPASNIIITYTAATGSYTATVSYTGKVATHFGGLFKVSYWNIAGSAASVIGNQFVEVDMLLDNSSSMLIGASDQDIVQMQALTVCSPTATAVANQAMGSGGWSYPSKYGYGTGLTVPPANKPVGNCITNFSGPADQCIYPITTTVPTPVATPAVTTVKSTGYCPTNYGVPVTTGSVTNWIPQAPCAFACHTNDGVHDYYTLVRAQTSPKITLRFDVVQSASAQVIQTMQSLEQTPNQFSVGVYEFNNTTTQVHPAPGGTFVEADTNLAKAQTDVQGIQTPITSDQPNTHFEAAAAYLAQNLQPAGNGATPATARKNLFIVTDGMDDWNSAVSGRLLGKMTDPTAETNCAPIKALGFTVYVLYTPYTPLANSWYLNSGNGVIQTVEPPTPDPPVVTALKACASTSGTGSPLYYEASSASDINAAMQAMLASALNSPARISN